MRRFVRCRVNAGVLKGALDAKDREGPLPRGEHGRRLEHTAGVCQQQRLDPRWPTRPRTGRAAVRHARTLERSFGSGPACSERAVRTLNPAAAAAAACVSPSAISFLQQPDLSVTRHAGSVGCGSGPQPMERDGLTLPSGRLGPAKVVVADRQR